MTGLSATKLDATPPTPDTTAPGHRALPAWVYGHPALTALELAHGVTPGPHNADDADTSEGMIRTNSKGHALHVQYASRFGTLTSITAYRETEYDNDTPADLVPATGVFGDELGNRVRSVRTAWERVRSKVGLPDVQLRDLRHEAGSRFDEAGVPTNYVSKILGHANLTTTTFTRAVNNPKKPYNSFSTEASGGPGKITWPAGHYLAADCAAVVKVTGSTFQVAAAFSCYTTFFVKEH